MQTKTASRCAVVLLACAASFGGDQRAAAQSPPDVYAAAQQEFAARIARYSTLRARLEDPLPSFDISPAVTMNKHESPILDYANYPSRNPPLSHQYGNSVVETV